MSTFITEANNKKKEVGKGKRNKVRNDELVDPDDYIPKRFGLKYNPPMIVLEYMVISLGKLYHHKMKLMRLKGDSDLNEMVDYLYNRHGFYLKESVVSRQQLANLVSRLQKRLPLEQNENIENRNIKQKNEKSSAPVSQLPGITQKKAKKVEDEWDDGGWGDSGGWGEEDDNKEKDYDNYDLNKLTVEELKKEKAKMDVVFEKNQKKPGDKDFVYDVRAEFKEPKED